MESRLSAPDHSKWRYYEGKRQEIESSGVASGLRPDWKNRRQVIVIHVFLIVMDFNPVKTTRGVIAAHTRSPTRRLIVPTW